MITDLRPGPAYKDSGVEPLGAVPTHWVVPQLRQVGRLLKGTGGTKDDDTHSGVPCVRYGQLYTTHDYFIRRPSAFITPERAADYAPIIRGDVLFAASGETIDEIGKSAVNLLNEPACCGGDLVLLRPQIEVHAPFLGYATDCRPSATQKASMGRGTTVKHLYPDQLKRLVIALPPLVEQAAIVRFLDHVDRRIRRYIHSKQKLIKLLEEQKQAIIHRAVTRGLDPNVRLKPSGAKWLGDVPEHWEVKRLRHVSPSVTVGVVVNPSSYFAMEGVPMLLGNNVLPGRLRLERVARISHDSNRALAKSRLGSGDVVVVRVGAPGTAAVVPEELEGCNCASMMIVRKGPAFVSEWLMYLFNSRVLQDQINVVKYGAAQKQFNIGHAVDFWCPLPGIAEQRRIVGSLAEQLGGCNRAIANGAHGVLLLREYRTRLIADVVTGKRDVREAAARLPDEPEEPEPTDEAEALAEGDEDGDAADHDDAPEEVEA